MAIRIAADSTCDLEKEQIERYKITILPLNIVMGEESYQDKINIFPDEIYEWAEKNRTTPKTSATDMGTVETLLSPLVEDGSDVIFFGISLKMSVMCQSVRLLAEEKGWTNVYIIDSMNLSTGIGLQVLKAAQMAEEGAKTQEIIDRITKDRERVRASFVVDTLTYLHRGGRCSAVASLIGNSLKLKPMIAVNNGSMGVAKKYRGNQNKVVMKYIKELEESLRSAEPERVFITHSGISEEIIDEVRQYLKEMHCFDEILVTRAGGVISSHCGPNTLGVLFYLKNE